MSKIIVVKSTGDIFETKADAIVNAVNCIGVMGAGIAKRFADEYPEMYVDYQKACRHREVDIGNCHFYNIQNAPNNWHYIINCPTMYYPGSKAIKNEIMAALLDLIMTANKKGIESIAMPYLGCGIGRLSKEDFEDILFETVNFFEKHINLHNLMTILLVDYKN